MKTKYPLVYIALISGLPYFSEATALPPVLGESNYASEQNKDSVLKYLIPALREQGKVGRVYYQATCNTNDYQLYFPEIGVTAPTKYKVGLSAIKNIFRNSDGVHVAEEHRGIVSVRIGRPAKEILATQISALSLDQESQYTASMAIIRIESSREVLDKIEKLGIEGPPLSSSILLNPPLESSPHLPPLIENVTMDDALNLVAKTFNAIVLYGACTNQSRYQVDFVNIEELR